MIGVDTVLIGAAATGTIVDDDATPTLSITSPSAPEGNAGTSVMNFVVSLSAISGQDVTFTRATADGSATTANNDYVAIGAALATIQAGQLSLTIPVTINGDTAFEGNETFSVNLTGITNATPGTLSGTGTIQEDDQQPTTTTITSDTPDPSVVGQPYPVNVTVAAQTSSPLGTVTISDGSASCGIVLPNTSCVMVPKALGAITLQARYDGDANFNGSTATASHTVTADGADLAILNRNQRRMVAAGQPSSFTVTVSNLGPQNVVNARVVDVLPAQFGDVSWTCAATAGASCPASGSGLIDTLVSLNAGTSVVFTLTATAQLTPEQIVTTTATVTAPVNASDPNLSNNSSSDSDPIGVFGDGLETDDE